MTQATDYDLFIIGGGINGTGVAADAAGRGLRVGLAEMSDLASATSSASSKLIHGGLRYLEHYEFRLVREALAEREVLLAKAPHLIWPLRFVLPHVPGVRPRWMVRAGLALYDNLAARKEIPGSRALDLMRDPAGEPLKPEYDKGFSYWDCWADDARLVVANAMAARDKGAKIETRTKVVACIVDGNAWRIRLSGRDGVSRDVRATALVNAAGPWVEQIESLARGNKPDAKAAHLRLVKGSHLVVPRIAGADSAYLMQNADKRVVFALPYEDCFTIIGTTDMAFTGDPAAVACSAEEEHYLLDLAQHFFKAPLTRESVVWRYSGVRPLYDDASDNPSAVTRDYHLELNAEGGAPPRLSVYGGKITTYRRLAEEALTRLAPHLGSIVGKPIGPAWTATAPLPGGALPAPGFEPFVADLSRRYPALDPLHLRRLARRHGALIADVLGDAKTSADLGQHFAMGLTAREVDYMKRQEWAVAADDVLWRRSKVGLHVLAAGSADERRAVEAAVAGAL